MVQKRLWQTVIVLGLALLFLAAYSALTAPPSSARPGAILTATPVPPATPTPRDYIFALSETIGPRVAGTPDEARAAQYIETVLRRIGYVTFTQPFSFTANTDAATALNSANVIAVKSGLSAREIIVGAHYDSAAVGRGADDNASGVAVLLAVAARIKGDPTPYTVKFVAFGAEEAGEQGSRYYVSQMSAADIQNTVAMINLDSLTDGDVAYIYGDAGEKGVIRNWVLAMAQIEGLDLQTQMGENPDYPAGTTGDWSDQAPFRRIGIPYAYFEATNWKLGEKDGYTQVSEALGEGGKIWHTVYDTLPYTDQ